MEGLFPGMSRLQQEASRSPHLWPERAGEEMVSGAWWSPERWEREAQVERDPQGQAAPVQRGMEGRSANTCLTRPSVS